MTPSSRLYGQSEGEGAPSSSPLYGGKVIISSIGQLELIAVVRLKKISSQWEWVYLSFLWGGYKAVCELWISGLNANQEAHNMLSCLLLSERAICMTSNKKVINLFLHRDLMFSLWLLWSAMNFSPPSCPHVAFAPNVAADYLYLLGMGIRWSARKTGCEFDQYVNLSPSLVHLISISIGFAGWLYSTTIIARTSKYCTWTCVIEINYQAVCEIIYVPLFQVLLRWSLYPIFTLFQP